ncbi:MAG: tRNA uridine-5-carboxymethylaminomethyl(34) synthesis GTPase MnmE [Burkholderia sp.]|nr:tRNA uridine-5-carboxymethylaminomethyl(34) synthesis GTPase MnmE [Burkholderia sp.]
MISADFDPIVAIATACGRGGIGIIRISFGRINQKNVFCLMNILCGRKLIPRYASFVTFIDEHTVPIDKGIAIYFQAPNSYTGEHILELHGHGSPIAMQLILRRCINAGQIFGLRLAEPGEFTRRAYLNNKLDLAQAESISDLIEASTEAAARSAARLLDGTFSRQIYRLVDEMIELRAFIEAMIDFSEERIDFLEIKSVHSKLTRIQAQVDRIISDAQNRVLLRNGLSIVLVGEPNVGKSSLLNALIGIELAIVTPIAGTTRDKVTETIQIEGIPLRIIDTAGLCDTDNEAEQIGIERTWKEIEKADVILHLLDARVGMTKKDDVLAMRFPSGVPVIRIFNKTDLIGLPAAVLLHDTHHNNDDMLTVIDESVFAGVRLSAMCGDGIDLLRGELIRIARRRNIGEDLYLVRERHLIELQATREHLKKANVYVSQQMQSSLDLFAEEIKLAQERLSAITGVFTSDDLLGEIFSRFCIGK